VEIEWKLYLYPPPLYVFRTRTRKTFSTWVFRYSGMSGCLNGLADWDVTSKRRYAITRCRLPY